MSTLKLMIVTSACKTHNKLPKIAANDAAGTNTHWASPNNVRICPLAKLYVSGQS